MTWIKKKESTLIFFEFLDFLDTLNEAILLLDRAKIHSKQKMALRAVYVVCNMLELLLEFL